MAGGEGGGRTAAVAILVGWWGINWICVELELERAERVD